MSEGECQFDFIIRKPVFFLGGGWADVHSADRATRCEEDAARDSISRKPGGRPGNLRRCILIDVKNLMVVKLQTMASFSLMLYLALQSTSSQTQEKSNPDTNDE